MPHALTETATFDTPITVPDDGDADAAASVDGAFQALTDRSAYLNACLPHGLLVGGDRITCDGTTIAVPALSFWINGARHDIAAASVTGPLTTTVPGWQYLYAQPSGAGPGAGTLVVSTDPPDASLTWRSTALNAQRYLAAFYATGASAFLAFRMIRGRYRASQPVPVSAADTTGALQPVSLAGIGALPPHGRRAHLSALAPNANGTAGANFRVASAGEAGLGHVVGIAPPSESIAFEFSVDLDGSQDFQWSYGGSGSVTQNVMFYVLAWEE